MIKLIGSCLVLMTTTWLGFQKAKKYSDRPHQIRQLRSALSVLKTEIGYGTRPLVQACEQIVRREQGPISILFESYQRNLKQLDGCSTYECFRAAVEREWGKTALTDAEKGIMLSFAQTLGASDREDQLNHVALADAHLKIEEIRAREEQMQYVKMYKTLGVLCGTLIIILIY